MTKKERAIQKAKELGAEYQKTVIGCAHCSFIAALDALRSEGIEVVSEEVEDEIMKGLVGLTGGVGNMGIGTCGAVIGSSAAVSLFTGIGRKENQDKANRWISYWNVKTGVVDKFLERYGSIICRDIQIKNFGRAYNSRISERSKELFETAKCMGCRTPEGCTIAFGAACAVEMIFRHMENPVDAEALKKKHEV